MEELVPRKVVTVSLSVTEFGDGDSSSVKVTPTKCVSTLDQTQFWKCSFFSPFFFFSPDSEREEWYSRNAQT